MSFLLDTNAVSEWTKPKPNANLIAWLASVDEDQTFLSVITIAEIKFGIERLKPGQRRSSLESWLRGDLGERFEGRILPVDAAVAEAWGKLTADRGALDQPAFNRNRLKAEKLIDFKVQQLPASSRTRAAVGRPLPIMDGFIAATAIVFGLTLVTRNTADFENTGAPLLNPWRKRRT